MTDPRSWTCKWSWDLNSGQTAPMHSLCESCKLVGSLTAESWEGLSEEGLLGVDLEG